MRRSWEEAKEGVRVSVAAPRQSGADEEMDASSGGRGVLAEQTLL